MSTPIIIILILVQTILVGALYWAMRKHENIDKNIGLIGKVIFSIPALGIATYMAIRYEQLTIEDINALTTFTIACISANSIAVAIIEIIARIRKK